MRKFNSWGRILETLTTPMTSHGIAAEVHLHPKTVARIMRAMLEEGLVHVAGWEHAQNRGPHAPVYALGKGRAARRPRPRTSVERAARYRESLTELERAAITARRRKPKCDIAASWIK